MTDPTGVDCQYCGRTVATDELLALHKGHSHDGRLDEGERAAYEAAHRAETETLRVYRLKVIAALVLLYFGFLFAYALFT